MGNRCYSNIFLWRDFCTSLTCKWIVLDGCCWKNDLGNIRSWGIPKIESPQFVPRRKCLRWALLGSNNTTLGWSGIVTILASGNPLFRTVCIPEWKEAKCTAPQCIPLIESQAAKQCFWMFWMFCWSRLHRWLWSKRHHRVGRAAYPVVMSYKVGTRRSKVRCKPIQL